MPRDTEPSDLKPPCPTAQETVIATPELLEHTISYLPLRDLLVTVPLVSTTWHAITQTPNIQQALFFEPDPSASERILNPLLVELFPPFFTEYEKNRFSWPTAKTIKSLPESGPFAAFRRPEASWRRMLVSQPPPQTMLIKQKSHGMRGDSKRTAVLHDLSLRMGTLYSLVLPFIDRVASSFRIQWHDAVDAEKIGCDLTLMTVYTVQCCPDLRRGRGRDGKPEFFSNVKVDAAVQEKFGEWRHCDRDYDSSNDEDDEDTAYRRVPRRSLAHPQSGTGAM
ncbi:F-box domain protein [Favolaschia claudopus]|uniref:F-box domain protein n=1 Tax=Favolaschia claudopus TaxID=2862362 RepID=A0AAW0DGQ7_9AGAR